jgi:nucleotide-binding universal stress UspA family protein
MSEKMKILIAYDGSDCANAALDDLHRAGLPKDAEAIVISVTEVWLPPPPPSALEVAADAEDLKVPADVKKVYAKKSKAMENAQAMADKAAERVKTNFPGWQVTAETAAGSPAWEIISKADAWKPDLIVVGSHGRSAVGRFFLGSVSQKVLTEARSSVRIARGRVEVDTSPVRVVVAVDGSAGSRFAVQSVASRSWPAESESRVIIVEDPLGPSGLARLVPPVAKMLEESNQEDLVWVQKTADKAIQELQTTELNVSSVVETGDPKTVIVEHAEKWGADCIFVGSTGLSGLVSRFLLGSVSAAVAARAHCSVEVVRSQ